MIRWSDGPMVRWSDGPMVCWSADPLIRWSADPMIRWSPDPMVRWSDGPMDRWDWSDARVFMCVLRRPSQARFGGRMTGIFCLYLCQFPKIDTYKKVWIYIGTKRTVKQWNRHQNEAYRNWMIFGCRSVPRKFFCLKVSKNINTLIRSFSRVPKKKDTKKLMWVAIKTRYSATTCRGIMTYYDLLNKHDSNDVALINCVKMTDKIRTLINLQALDWVLGRLYRALQRAGIRSYEWRMVSLGWGIFCAVLNTRMSTYVTYDMLDYTCILIFNHDLCIL